MTKRSTMTGIAWNTSPDVTRHGTGLGWASWPAVAALGLIVPQRAENASWLGPLCRWGPFYSTLRPDQASQSSDAADSVGCSDSEP
jgi:hypothetical protein